MESIYKKIGRITATDLSWWEHRDSNPGPSACKADALNQLSYTPLFLFSATVALFPDCECKDTAFPFHSKLFEDFLHLFCKFFFSTSNYNLIISNLSTERNCNYFFDFRSFTSLQTLASFQLSKQALHFHHIPIQSTVKNPKWQHFFCSIRKEKFTELLSDRHRKQLIDDTFCQ